MAASLIYQELGGDAPATYVVPATLEMSLLSVSVQLDGDDSASRYVPCLALYSQDNRLIGRWIAPEAVPDGDNASVTFSLNSGLTATDIAWQSATIISAASNNAQVVAATSGKVHGWSIFNTAAVVRYVKLYSADTTPDPAVNVPEITLAIPPGQTVDLISEQGLEFSFGIGLLIVAGPEETNDVPVAAGDIVMTLLYV